MADATAQRRALVHYLERHPLTKDVDWTRDGYQTVILTLGDPGEEAAELEECGNCGAVGLRERIQDHDCRAFCEWRADR